MDIIKNLEQKFEKIDAKLNNDSNINSINRISSVDSEKLNRIFHSTKENQYENGLNACRDEMLKQIINKRNEQLEQVTNFRANSNQNDLNKLKSLHETLKPTLISFAHGFNSVYESILARARFEFILNLNQLDKYSHLLQNTKTFSLLNKDNLLRINIIENNFHLLPAGLLLTWSGFQADNQSYMVIINKTGKIIHSKKLNFTETKQNNRPYCFKVNATHICAYNKANSVIEIYNFKLELVHSFNLPLKYSHFRLCNQDIGFYDPFGSVFTCYNFKTKRVKKTDVKLDKMVLLKEARLSQEKIWLDFLDLNEKFLFMNGNFFLCEQSSLFVLDRANCFCLFKFIRCKTPAYWFTYHDQVCFRDLEQRKIYVYEMSEEKDEFEIIDGHKNVFNYVYSTSNYKYVYSNFNLFKYIQFKEY